MTCQTTNAQLPHELGSTTSLKHNYADNNGGGNTIDGNRDVGSTYDDDLRNAGGTSYDNTPSKSGVITASEQPEHVHVQVNTISNISIPIGVAP